jgi:competence protein ComGC
LDDNKQISRSFRQAKRRKNQRIIYMLILLAVIAIVILLLLLFNSSNDDNQTASNKDNVNYETVNNDVEEEIEQDNDAEIIEEEQEESIYDVEIIVQLIDSDDENVIEAYVGNWPPIGTSQEEPHVTDFTKNSTDWLEMREAVLFATNIKDEDLIELWFGNGGEQKVIATVQDRSSEEIYRVYLSWIEEAGWQPTRVEKLKEYIPS